MKLFSNNIVPYASTEGDKIYPIVVDIKKGIKSGEAISFVTADNQVGVITVDFMDGNSSYSIEGCMVTSTIHRPDGTVLEIPCDIISQSTIEIPLGINGTYQEGTHTFDLKIVRGSGKVIGVPTMSYSVSGSLSSDDVVEGDDRLPVLTMVLDNAQDKLTRLDKAIAGATNDLEVKEARDGEVTLNARLERDLAKGKIHFVDVEGTIISTESEEGYLENVEIHGNTWQDANNLSDIRSVGTKVEGQELYEIPILSTGKNLFDGKLKMGYIATNTGIEGSSSTMKMSFDYIRVKPNTKYALFFHSGEDYANVFTYDKDKNFISYKGFKESFTTESNAYYIRFYNTYNNDLEANVQLEEGTQATPYEPYQEDKLTILSPTPLEKVGDVADRIICKDGVWGVEKNIISLTFTGIENWRIDTNGTFYMSSSEWKGVPHKPNCVCITDIFASAMGTNDINDKMFMGNSYLFMIKPSGIASVDEWKSYLNANNLKVKYATTQPQFIPLPHDQQVKLRTFAERTHIHFETEIEGTIKAQVPKSLGATVNTHTTQIDNLNKELDRVKKLEESTVSTVTTDKAFTTVSETNGGYFEDVKIKGKTLVNLAPKYEINYNATSDYDGFMPLLQNSYGTQSSSVGRVLVDIKPSTEYTVFFNVVEKEDSKYYNMNNASNAGVVFETNMLINSTGAYVFKVMSKSDLTKAYMVLRSQNSTSRGKIHIKDIVILEGDHTDKDISYFEGIMSVGEGVEGIGLKSVNKNLLEIEREGYYRDYSTGNLTVKSDFNSCIAKVMPNTRYRISTNGGTSSVISNLCFFDQDFKYIKGVANSVFDFVTPSNCAYITVAVSKELPNVQIEKGDNVTYYVPPKSHSKALLYYNPTTQTWEKPILREWDSIEKHSDGKYYYHKRSNEMVLNGSEGWYSVSTLENVIGFGVGVDLHGVTDLSKIVSDRFNYVGDDKLGQIRLGNSGKSIFIYTDKTKLSTQDVAGFKAWLQANPTTVVYQLAKEEVYECTNLDLITHNGETNLIVNSGAIQPRVTLKVLSNVSNVVKLLQEKVAILENKFIEGLKQVLSGDMMSLAHLLYPEDFEH